MTEAPRSSSLIMLGEAARRGCVGALACRLAAGMKAADELMRVESIVMEVPMAVEALSKKRDAHPGGIT